MLGGSHILMLCAAIGLEFAFILQVCVNQISTAKTKRKTRRTIIVLGSVSGLVGTAFIFRTDDA